jgi:hypothetical protein
VVVVERTAVCGRRILGMQLEGEIRITIYPRGLDSKAYFPHLLDASKIDVGYRVRVDRAAE